MKRSFSKLALVACVVSVASASQAWIINTGGTYTGGEYPSWLTGLTESSNLFPGSFGWSTSFSYNATTQSGTEAFSDGTRTLDINYSGNILQVGGSQLWYGTWTATNIVGLNTNTTGNYTFSFDGINNWSETVTGQPAATPEPATLGILGVGFMALVRRRRKSR